MLNRSVVLSFVLAIFCPYFTSSIDPLVFTKLGLIRGLSSDDGSHSMFLGIPYAIVDEENPFGLAFPYPTFEEPFDAYNGTIKCLQLWNGQIEGQLQCLNLNIFVPNKVTFEFSNHLLPVMVYIHGGAFMHGSSTNLFRPDNFINKDVIIISFNYRLSIYGFLCTDSPKAPGNIGLKDQLIALRWIQDNIGYFGGDNTKITAFGESAGGMSIHLHMLSQHEKLFDRAIIESGPATSPFTIYPVNNDLAFNTAKILGFETEDLDAAIEFISKSNVDMVTGVAGQMIRVSQYTKETVIKICIEKEFDGIERFVSENPNAAYVEKSKIIPVIIGHTSQEMIFEHLENKEFFDNYSFKDLLNYGFDVSDFENMTDIVRQFYIGDEAPSKFLENEITSFASDFIFNHPTKRTVDLFILSGFQAIYQYMFSYKGSLSLGTKQNTTIEGASHGDEIYYYFQVISGNDKLSKEDKLTVDRIVTLWTNFAKFGNPTPEITELIPVIWEPVSANSVPYLDINKDVRLQHRVFHNRMAFWDIFYRLNESKTSWSKITYCN